ncbi:RND transporter [Frigoribacterium sp. Leaf164]|uniref:MMPL family transporter n=1 Tax=Frigoribacterium sp. Leaf164 TaxID=1736282 RepID=UPI0006F4D5C8|nr:MMPL family transporter [Frigoribacterium sp. Leaf164]KQR46849.1 RND transporter [Frigoribacterium sp. Leaf164]
MSLFLSRIGRFSARHRLLVAGVWLVVFASLVGAFAIGSQRDAPAEAERSASSSTAAAQTLDRLHDEFPATDTETDAAADTLQLVFQVPSGTTVSDAANSVAIGDVLAVATDLPGVTSVSDPLDPAAPFVSEDGRTAVATLSYSDLGDTADKTGKYDAALDLQRSAPSGLRVELGGDLLETQAPEAGIGEGIGVIAALLVLVLTFGSLLAAGANLLVAAFGVGVGVVGILTYGAFFPMGDNTLILAAMLGLAVGIDYSLFILSRFRAELREGRGVEDAVARSVGTAGTAVVFAGLTVIVALVGLLVVGMRDISEMGVAAAAAVAIAVLIALTLLPVLMRTLGRRVLPRRELHVRETARAADTSARRGFLAGWARTVVAHPVLAMVAGVAVLVIVALPTLSMKTAFNVPGGTDPESTERAAYTLVLDEFGGVQSPLVVLAEGTDAGDRSEAVSTELSRLDGVQSVSPGLVSDDGDAVMYSVVPTGSPIDDRTIDLVSAVRDDASVSGVTLEVTGEAAIYIDEDAALNQALIKYMILIAVLSLVLLTVLFRSLVIPVIATLGYLLSLLASFGGSVAVFQWGWLDALIPAPQGDPMLSLLPILLVGVLFGLAMDYQVFLVSRIQEMHSKGMSPKEAVVAGFTRSAPVLVAAGSIMAVVFAGFASSTMAVAASIAFGLVVGVLADVFLVRLVLMPAALALLGKAAWWTPAWLDRLLPRLDIEGHALDAQDEASRDATSSDEHDPELVRA